MTEMQLNYLRQMESERANREAERIKDEANLLKSEELGLRREELALEQALNPYRAALLQAQEQAQLANVSISEVQRLAQEMSLPGSAGYRAMVANTKAAKDADDLYTLGEWLTDIALDRRAAYSGSSAQSSVDLIPTIIGLLAKMA